MEINRRKFIQLSSFLGAELLLVKIGSANAAGSAKLSDKYAGISEVDFLNPPDEAKASCYWWWFNSLVDREGITEDLKEFRDKGLGGVLLINSSNGFGSGPIPKGPEFLSEEWLSLYRHAISEADKYGIEVGVNLSTGWAMGGAWIKPEESGRWFLQSKLYLKGPQKFSSTLPLPGNRDGYDGPNFLFVKDFIDLPLEQADYRDTSIIAYRDDSAGKSGLGTERLKLLAAKSNRLDASSHAEANDVMRSPLVPWSKSAADKPVSSTSILDLTSKLKPNGILEWDVPEGNWTIIRTGHRMTGARTAYALEEAAGLEIDWLNKNGVEKQFEYLGSVLLKEAEKSKGKSLKYFHDDSFEDGFPNWTDNILQQFEKYRGYDPVPYLPVFAGVIVDNAEISDRFLYDYRKTVADCFADGHYKRFAELCHENGLLVQSEAAGPSWSGTICMDGLKNLGRMDLPMGEFWHGKNFTQHDQNQVNKMVASAAHIYGKKKASAEAFTNTFKPNWSFGPDVLKPLADKAFCEGINRCVIHTSTAVRERDGKPGIEYGAGTHFNRNVTWWSKAGSFLNYLNRCQYLLQSGLFVADVLYYNGDWAPNLVPPRHMTDPSLGKDYDYDVCNSEVLLNRLSVKNNKLTLPDGMSYRILVLPDSDFMPVEIAAKIRELVKLGATILGQKPVRAPGLNNYPQCDKEVQAIADDIWGTSDVRMRKYGKGRVFSKGTAREILLRDGVGPDFTYTGDGNYIDYIHRSTPDMEIYFLFNRSEKDVKTNCTFRIKNRKPQFWDALTGKILTAPSFKIIGNTISVPFELFANQSIFVVFPASGPKKLKTTDEWFFQDRSGLLDVQEITGEWQVEFDTRWGGPAVVTFNALQDWRKHSNQSIKYYSGRAVYTKKIVISKGIITGKPVILDLGSISNVAHVYLNGKDLGVVWTKPWMVDITNTIKEGENVLKVEVINLWLNRLLGDAELPAGQRLTKTNIVLKKSDKLLPSGLLGPVVIKRKE